MSDLPGIRPAERTAPASPSTGALATPSPRQDDDARWLTPLASAGPAHDRAVGELHRLLLRASTFEVRPAICGPGPRGRARSSTTSPTRRPTTRCSPSCRGSTASSAAAASRPGPTSSRSTRRASPCAGTPGAIATLSAELEREPRAAHAPVGRPRPRPRRRESCSARISTAITRLTAHQRDVLLALAVDGVPIDVLADRLSTNRNALYKTLHDARTRLRRLLDEEETTHDHADATARGGAARARRARDRLRRVLRAARRLRRAGDRGRRRRGVDARHARAPRRLPRVPRGARVAPRLRR